MEQLIALDQHLFFLINHEWTQPFLDYVAPFWRSKYFWLPLYFFLLAFTWINFSKNRWIFFLFILITITSADTMSSKVIKPAVERLRPCNEPALQESVDLKVPCGGGYSFPSSHATNHFALAFFLIWAGGQHFRFIRIPLILWAGSIAYGQVYVGVHYPVDVLAGSLLGICLGSFFGFIYRKMPPLLSQTATKTLVG